ncbi:MAG: ABC transporter substrate-binding protein [Chloroflexi bacterium]|nr:ABC transporter substrate-binding protein [Chloroflexota bacterium]
MAEQDVSPKATGSRVDRRKFLKVTLGAGGALLVGACGGDAPPAPAPKTNESLKPAAPAPATSGSTPAAASAAPATAPATPAKVGTETIRIAIGVDPDTLEPVGQTTTTVQNIVDYMVESLVALGEDGRPRPALAESWEVSPDGKTYTFKLRQGVKFHDGATFNAEAVKLSFDRVINKDMKVPLRAPMDNVEAVTPVDANTVRFNLKTAFPPFIAAMTASQYGIVSPEVAKGNPTSYREEPIGTGPYQFKSRAKGSEVILVRNESYWGRKPYYQTVQFRVVPEAATRESLLLANQAEMIILPPISDIPRLQQNSQVKVVLAPSNRTIFIAIDTTRPGPVQDPKFRQALNYAVDKEGIIKSVMFGAAEAMDAPMSSQLFGYCKVGSYAYDPNKAKQILRDGGWTNVSLKMVHPSGRYVQDAQASQAIAGNLRDVGLNVETATSDWPTYLATINVPPDKATADIHLLGWAPGFLDAAQQMVQFKKSAWPPAGLATSHYTNPQVEDLLTKADQNQNEKERAEQYCQASQLIWNDAPWIFLWVQRFPIVYSAKVKGIGALATEKFSALYAEPA